MFKTNNPLGIAAALRQAPGNLQPGMSMPLGKMGRLNDAGRDLLKQHGISVPKGVHVSPQVLALLHDLGNRDGKLTPENQRALASMQQICGGGPKGSFGKPHLIAAN